MRARRPAGARLPRDEARILRIDLGGLALRQAEVRLRAVAVLLQQPDGACRAVSWAQFGCKLTAN
jgi:hypothetical protein